MPGRATGYPGPHGKKREIRTVPSAGWLGTRYLTKNAFGPRSIPEPCNDSRRSGRQGKDARSGSTGERLRRNYAFWRVGNHSSSDNATQENQAPREPVSTLKAAIMCINATLDIDTALGNAVVSTRALTGARDGAIVTVDKVPPGPLIFGLAARRGMRTARLARQGRPVRALRTLPGPARRAASPVCVGAPGMESGIPSVRDEHSGQRAMRTPDMESKGQRN